MDQGKERHPLSSRRWQPAFHQSPPAQTQLKVIKAEQQQGPLALKPAAPPEAQLQDPKIYGIAEQQALLIGPNLQARCEPAQQPTTKSSRALLAL